MDDKNTWSFGEKKSTRKLVDIFLFLAESRLKIQIIEMVKQLLLLGFSLYDLSFYHCSSKVFIHEISSACEIHHRQGYKISISYNMVVSFSVIPLSRSK